MNVLMICALDIWSMGEGRGAPTIYRTLKAFNDAGHTVHLILPAGHASDGAESDVLGLVRALEHVRLWPLRYPRSAKERRGGQGRLSRAWDRIRLVTLFPLFAAWEGRRILQSEQIDVLYGYEVHGVIAIRLIRRLKPLPSVARFQGSVMDPNFRTPLNLARRPDHLIALSAPADLYIMTDDGTLGDATLTRLNRHSRKRLRFWRNGIDLERFRPASEKVAALARRTLAIPPESPVVVAISRLVRWKRLDRAIKAWARVIARRPDAQFLIVGDGDERLRLKRLARLVGVESSVCFVGAVPQREVMNYLRAADIFLSVNDLSNAGNPLMEAIACGKAIVTLNNGSTGRLIKDGVTGMLLEPDDDAALAGAIVRLIEDRTMRERLEQQARQLAESSFWSWEKRMAAEIEAVSELLPSPPTEVGA